MRTSKMELIVFFLNIVCFVCVAPNLSYAVSDSCPAYEDAPALTSYVSGGSFSNIYYIAPTGSDSSGDGSMGNPWGTINGARTGGAGPGDLIYFRGGTYTATQASTSWRHGYYYYDIDGSPSNYTVFSAYPGETPVFNASGDNRYSISIRGDYVVLDSLTFGSGPLGIIYGTHVVVQNCSFDGNPYDAPADQINDTHLYIHDGAHYTTVRNSYFATQDGHAIKVYSSENMPTNLTYEYNRFYGGNVSYGLVNFKSAITNNEIRYNRFEGVTRDVITIGPSYSGSHNGLNIHHNVFDGCRDSILVKQGSSNTGQVRNLDFHNNVIYNASSGDRDMLELDSDDGRLSGTTSRLGEFYNNIFYNLADVIDPESTSDFTNYPSYFNYNAYPSIQAKSTAENQNSESSSNWQRSALIQSSPGITRTGVPGNRFYTIEDNNQFVGAGREGSTIGGFEWSGGTQMNPNPPSDFQIIH